jgi:hypothetical protein
MPSGRFSTTKPLPDAMRRPTTASHQQTRVTAAEGMPQSYALGIGSNKGFRNLYP